MADKNSKMNVNPTPKVDFQSNPKFISMHREMMQQPMLSVSLQYAQLQFERELFSGRLPDGNTAAANAYKIQGVLEFLHILKNLAEMPEIPKVTHDNSKLTPI